jgi:hypothetical protein
MLLRIMTLRHWRVDKLHWQGHIGKWCAQHCDPTEDAELEGVNTVVCEIGFSWLARRSTVTHDYTTLYFPSNALTHHLKITVRVAIH